MQKSETSGRIDEKKKRAWNRPGLMLVSLDRTAGAEYGIDDEVGCGFS
ncbi:hypothetical protein P7L70_02345 (plasmid) [Tistrella mobilis]